MSTSKKKAQRSDGEIIFLKDGGLEFSRIKGKQNSDQKCTLSTYQDMGMSISQRNCITSSIKEKSLNLPEKKKIDYL